MNSLIVLNTANFTAFLASGNGALIVANDVTVSDSNLANNTLTNINLSVNAASGGVVTLNGGSITTNGTDSNNRAYGINAGVGGAVNANEVSIQTTVTQIARWPGTSHG
jgi:hypothetical protein